MNFKAFFKPDSRKIILTLLLFLVFIFLPVIPTYIQTVGVGFSPGPMVFGGFFPLYPFFLNIDLYNIQQIGFLFYLIFFLIVITGMYICACTLSNLRFTKSKYFIYFGLFVIATIFLSYGLYMWNRLTIYNQFPQIRSRYGGGVGPIICLGKSTLIDTPDGPVLVNLLHKGSLVWTRSRIGTKVVTEVLAVSHTVAPIEHTLTHLYLADGRNLSVSAGHPTIDGRTIRDISLRDILDGSEIYKIETVPYGGEETFDILPSGDTGFYWANGILIGSSLKKNH